MSVIAFNVLAEIPPSAMGWLSKKTKKIIIITRILFIYMHIYLLLVYAVNLTVHLLYIGNGISLVLARRIGQLSARWFG